LRNVLLQERHGNCRAGAPPPPLAPEEGGSRREGSIYAGSARFPRQRFDLQLRLLTLLLHVARPAASPIGPPYKHPVT
jgi:hypothetical protein